LEQQRLRPVAAAGLPGYGTYTIEGPIGPVRVTGQYWACSLVPAYGVDLVNLCQIFDFCVQLLI
jgi:hypothetical protein